MAGLGPMTGQVTWFKRAAAKPDRDPRDTSYAIHRYEKEMARLYAVLERQLDGREHICGDYTIADIACWPWVDQHHGYLGELDRFPNINRWHSRIGDRPAIKRAMTVGTEGLQPPSG